MDDTARLLAPSWATGECPIVYGPVSSRRHGLSLGINLGDPTRKHCGWSCLYCQAGFERASSAPLRRPDAADVLRQLEVALATSPTVDSVTFAGNSEPTDHPRFAEIIRGVLELRQRKGGRWKVICLSNGMNLEDEEVRKACDVLDETWIKLDCASDADFRVLNHPRFPEGRVLKHVERIARLKNRRIQTLLWRCPEKPHLGNYNSRNLEGLVRLLALIRPLAVHVTTIERAPAYDALQPVSLEDLEGFAHTLRCKEIPAQAFKSIS